MNVTEPFHALHSPGGNAWLPRRVDVIISGGVDWCQHSAAQGLPSLHKLKKGIAHCRATRREHQVFMARVKSDKVAPLGDVPKPRHGRFAGRQSAHSGLRMKDGALQRRNKFQAHKAWIAGKVRTKSQGRARRNRNMQVGNSPAAVIGSGWK